MIDDYITLCKNVNDDQLEELYKLIDIGKEFGVRLIITENEPQFDSKDDLMEMSSKIGAGILLGGSEALDEFNDTKVPGEKTYNLPPGRGYIVCRKKTSFFQAATFYERDEDPSQVLKYRLDLLRKEK